MTVSQNDKPDDKNTPPESDQSKINRILLEFGLDPRDYIFKSSREQIFDHPSAFTKYPQKKPSITSGRPLSYVQQPPPPRPIIKRQASRTQLPKDMTESDTDLRGTSPSPPPPPISDRNFNKSDSNLSAEHYLRHIDSQDTPPVKVVKPNSQNVVYKKEIRIRYLQPPTPPPPAPIIIRERHIPPPPPESPLLIRETKPQAHTPPPLTIRERPPTPPPQIEPFIVEKALPPPPPQPRQIIIERLPTPPPKPRTVIFEKWLPYKKVKRPILLQKAPPIAPTKPVRNVIIEYEPLKAYTVRRVIEEGIFRVDPNDFSSYNTQRTDRNVRFVDRIDDLPPPSEDLMRELQNYNINCQPGPSTNIDFVTNISHASNIPTNRQERVLSPGSISSIPSPTGIQSKHSSRRQTPQNNPIQSKHSSRRQTPQDNPMKLISEDNYQ